MSRAGGHFWSCEMKGGSEGGDYSPAVRESSLRTMRSDEHLRTNAAQLSDCCLCVSAFGCTLCVCSALVGSNLYPLALTQHVMFPRQRPAHHILLFVCVCVCAPSDVSWPNSSGLCCNVCMWLPWLPVVSFYRVQMRMQLQVRLQPDKGNLSVTYQTYVRQCRDLK